MAVDPYVPTRQEDAPRRSVAIPPAAGWRAVRPGDIDPATGSGRTGLLFGTPGPDSGYALTLAERFHDQITAVRPETGHDAQTVAAQVAMRRGGLFGRAPVRADVEEPGRRRREPDPDRHAPVLDDASSPRRWRQSAAIRPRTWSGRCRTTHSGMASTRAIRRG